MKNISSITATLNDEVDVQQDGNGFYDVTPEEVAELMEDSREKTDIHGLLDKMLDMAAREFDGQSEVKLTGVIHAGPDFELSLSVAVRPRDLS